MRNKTDLDSTEVRDARDEKRVVITFWKMITLLVSGVLTVFAATWTLSANVNQMQGSVQAGAEATTRLQGEVKARFDGIDNRMSSFITVNEFEAYLRYVRALNKDRVDLPPFR